MTGGNESCIAGPIPMSYLTCLTYILQEWTGVEHIGDYLSYAFYLVWVLFPLVVVFILPGIIVALFYISILLLHIYKRKNELKEAYSHDVWIGAREMLATLWDGHGRIWHGYELHGIKNIPEGPGLVVFYHGPTPVDYIYFMARLHVTTKRRCRVVADHFVFRLPGFKILLDVHGVIPGPREACVSTLKEGHLLAIAPGGVREALFSDEMYTILWSNRKGFAQVAIDAKVPIIPMFTQNVREGFRTLGRIKLLRSLYERIRLPVVPLYGGFPVKLRTFIGEPIPYEPNMTAEELAAKIFGNTQDQIYKVLLQDLTADRILHMNSGRLYQHQSSPLADHWFIKTKAAVQALIEKHQKIPGNIFRALMERFQSHKKDD